MTDDNEKQENRFAFCSISVSQILVAVFRIDQGKEMMT
jgi:hypothetical protein